ncbi:hypothetical protein ACWIG5_31335 [Streptomyces lydicus]
MSLIRLATPEIRAAKLAVAARWVPAGNSPRASETSQAIFEIFSRVACGSEGLEWSSSQHSTWKVTTLSAAPWYTTDLGSIRWVSPELTPVWTRVVIVWRAPPSAAPAAAQ